MVCKERTWLKLTVPNYHYFEKTVNFYQEIKFSLYYIVHETSANYKKYLCLCFQIKALIIETGSAYCNFECKYYYSYSIFFLSAIKYNKPVWKIAKNVATVVAAERWMAWLITCKKYGLALVKCC